MELIQNCSILRWMHAHAAALQLYSLAPQAWTPNFIQSSFKDNRAFV